MPGWRRSRCRRRASRSAPTRAGSRPGSSASGSGSRSRSTPSARSGTPTAARDGPASSSGASAAPSRWFHFGEGEYLGTEEAIQAELRESDALRQDLPAPMAPLRDTDGPGARVMAPTPEAFPGGSWERPWTAGEDGEELVLPYEAGGAYATLEGEGEVIVLTRRRRGAWAGRRRRGRPPRARRAPSPREHTSSPSGPPPAFASGRSASRRACRSLSPALRTPPKRSSP